jgi:outer membrane protein OmpA-like peptidoglycan-associated protein
LDGIYDAYDECPTMAEDYDGWEDGDGCPDPDNDGDGVCDPWVAGRGQLELYAHICRGVDLCPEEPEDFDGFEDEDGCPDPDNDGDGILDKDDRCPNEPEDFDGFEDDDGCLDPDNDLDGILDESDQCPNEPEIFNGYQDEDGCPEPDRDGDGIVDDLDDCPDEPETINGIDDEDGCPDKGIIEVKDNKVLIGDRIFFDLGQARLKTEGKNVLDHVHKLIDGHPEYLLISIEGHADQTGPAKLNQKLSLRRADAVRRHLIKLGVEPKRLVVRGFGDKDPWKEERRVMHMNRRVEIVIEKIDERLAKSPVAKHVVEGVSRASTKSETSSPKTSSPARPGNAEESPYEN